MRVWRQHHRNSRHATLSVVSWVKADYRQKPFRYGQLAIIRKLSIVCATRNEVQCFALANVSKAASSRLFSLTSKLPFSVPVRDLFAERFHGAAFGTFEARADTHNHTPTQLEVPQTPAPQRSPVRAQATARLLFCFRASTT